MVPRSGELVWTVVLTSHGDESWSDEVSKHSSPKIIWERLYAGAVPMIHWTMPSPRQYDRYRRSHLSNASRKLQKRSKNSVTKCQPQASQQQLQPIHKIPNELLQEKTQHSCHRCLPQYSRCQLLEPPPRLPRLALRDQL